MPRSAQPYSVLSRLSAPDLPGLGAELIALGCTLRMGNADAADPTLQLYLPIIAALIRQPGRAVTNLKMSEDPVTMGYLATVTLRIGNTLR